MKIHRYQCKQCGVELTDWLYELTSPFMHFETENEDHLPAGFTSLSDGEYFTHSEGRFLINAKDLRNFDYHPEPGRHIGCCGRDGLEGPNLICKNGHEIGTEVSDCWLAHAIILLPEKVRIESATRTPKAGLRTELAAPGKRPFYCLVLCEQIDALFHRLEELPGGYKNLPGHLFEKLRDGREILENGQYKAVSFQWMVRVFLDSGWPGKEGEEVMHALDSIESTWRKPDPVKILTEALTETVVMMGLGYDPDSTALEPFAIECLEARKALGRNTRNWYKGENHDLMSLPSRFHTSPGLEKCAEARLAIDRITRLLSAWYSEYGR